MTATTNRQSRHHHPRNVAPNSADSVPGSVESARRIRARRLDLHPSRRRSRTRGRTRAGRARRARSSTEAPTRRASRERARPRGSSARFRIPSLVLARDHEAPRVVLPRIDVLRDHHEADEDVVGVDGAKPRLGLEVRTAIDTALPATYPRCSAWTSSALVARTVSAVTSRVSPSSASVSRSSVLGRCRLPRARLITPRSVITALVGSPTRTNLQMARAWRERGVDARVVAGRGPLRFDQR